MRSLALIATVTLALGTLAACATGPIFKNITSVKIRHIGSDGLTETFLEERQQRAVIKCLNNTAEITESKALRDLLQTTYLVEIVDKTGDRSFELYTRQNLKGNKGKYYVNRCLYKLIVDAQ